MSTILIGSLKLLLAFWCHRTQLDCSDRSDIACSLEQSMILATVTQGSTPLPKGKSGQPPMFALI